MLSVALFAIAANTGHASDGNGRVKVNGRNTVHDFNFNSAEMTELDKQLADKLLELKNSE